MTTSSSLSRFDIDFDNTENSILIVHGGELLTGNLRIQLCIPLTIQAIRLQFKGLACCKSDGEAAEKTEVYFDHDWVLLERPPGHLEAGDFLWKSDHLYTLPFECPLPIDCPTSYECPYGFARYFAKANLQLGIADEGHSYIVKKAFTMIRRVPTNNIDADSELMSPIVINDTATFGGCCRPGSLSVQVALSKSVFRPGEMIRGSVKIATRHLRRAIDRISVRLFDRLVIAGSKTTIPLRCLLQRDLDDSRVSAGSDWNRSDMMLLHLPAVPPSSTISSLFSVEFLMHLIVGPKFVLEIPIHVDSVDGPHRPFVAGPQNIGDDNESDIAGELFMFTPMYSVAPISDQMNGK